jgi:hypothetical protein
MMEPTMPDTHDPIAAIPDPGTIRTQLEEAVRRVDILRRLLRLAMRAKAKHSDHAQAVEVPA